MLRSQALWCTSHRRIKLRGEHYTVESNCTAQSENIKFRRSLVAFKGTVRRNPFGVNTSIMKEKI